jgi:hypothetical protein
MQTVNQLLIDEALRMKVRVIGSTVVMLLACERRCVACGPATAGCTCSATAT